MAAAIEDAFGVRPFDLYATTEGLWGATCAEHAGITSSRTSRIVENVDERRPPGARRRARRARCW